MTAKRPATIAAYIQAAPPAGRPRLRRLNALLKRVAPRARGVIKWGTPFFIEPRFLFAFSAHKAHLDFVPTRAVMAAFRPELAGHQTTKYMLQVPYDAPLPEALIVKMAKACLKEVSERKSGSFW